MGTLTRSPRTSGVRGLAGVVALLVLAGCGGGEVERRIERDQAAARTTVAAYPEAFCAAYEQVAQWVQDHPGDSAQWAGQVAAQLYVVAPLAPPEHITDVQALIDLYNSMARGDPPERQAPLIDPARVAAAAVDARCASTAG